jgi:hypothetical protein
MYESVPNVNKLISTKGLIVNRLTAPASEIEKTAVGQQVGLGHIQHCRGQIGILSRPLSHPARPGLLPPRLHRTTGRATAFFFAWLAWYPARPALLLARQVCQRRAQAAAKLDVGYIAAVLGQQMGHLEPKTVARF